MHFHNFKAAKPPTGIRPLFLIAGALSAGTLFSTPEPVAAQSIEAELICSSVTELSALLFVQRQNGAERTELEVSVNVGDENLKSILAIAVDGALAYPMLSDNDAKKKLGQFFAASMKLVCLDQYSTVPSITKEDSATTANDESQKSTNEVGETPVIPDWADPTYPEIDYNTFGFQGLKGSGSKIYGYWGLSIEKDAISDETITTAINVSNWIDSEPSNQFFLACHAGEAGAGLLTNGYLTSDRSNKVKVAYRLDGGEAVETRWFANKGLAATKGKQAEAFIRQLADSSSVILRVTERDGESHDVNVSLQGVVEIAEKIAEACRFSLLVLSKEDLRRVQSLLNAAGYNSGTPDGLWGPGSKRALGRFQEENGLEKTGIVDKASLNALGY